MTETRSLLRASTTRDVALMVLGLLAYALLTTWPVVLDLDSSMFGAVPGDLSGAVAHAREVVEQRIFPFAPATIHDFNAPQGLAEPWVLNIATAPGTALLYSLSYVAGALPGHTLFTIFGYVASGISMFSLARSVSKSTAGGVVAGFAFAFYPFAVNKGLGHLHFVHGWVLVVPVWRAWRMVASPTPRNGLWFGLSVALALWFTPYFILMGAVLAAACGVVVLVLGWRTQRTPTVTALAISVAPVVLLAGLLLTLQTVAAAEGAAGARTHVLDELVVFSARPHEYVVPDRNNVLVGNLTEPFLVERLHGSNFSENSIYVGLSVLALAAIGLAVALRHGGRTRQEGTGATLGAAVVVAGFLFSLPPEVDLAGLTVPMPSFFVFKVTSTWRVYSRFVMLVMLGLSVLASLGVARLLRTLTGRGRTAAVAALLALVLLDLSARPPGAVTTPPVPGPYRTLAAQPSGNVAVYPIEPAEIPNASPIWYHHIHDHPVINGYASGTLDESRKLELADLADDDTAPALRHFGVRYVVVHPGYALGPPGPDFELLDADGALSLYRVRPGGPASGVDAGSGFGPVEGQANQQQRWMYDAEGLLVAWSDCGRCSGTLAFATSSAGVERTIELRVDGTVVHSQTIGTAPTLVTVPLEVRGGEVSVEVEISPPPAIVGGDPRELGVLISEPTFVAPTDSGP